jgi:outer membrane lipoprotein carrier protein
LEITPSHQIARIAIEEVDGSVTEYRFTDQKENLSVPDDRFNFSPPAGVEVIEGTLSQ